MNRSAHDTGSAASESIDPRLREGAVVLGEMVWVPGDWLRCVCATCGAEVAYRVMVNHYMREHPDVDLEADDANG